MKTRIIAVVALLALVVGCSSSATTGGSSAAPQDLSGKVTVWMYPVIADAAKSQAFWAEAEQAFEAQHPKVDLTIELQPWAGRDEKVATAIASGKGPDLVLLTPDGLPGYATNGGLKSLKGAQDPAFLPAAVNAATVGGEVYAVPLYQTVVTTAYNKALFTAAGVSELPTTFAEVKAAAPRLAANGVAVMDYSGDPKVTLNQTFYPLLWSAGGKVFNADGKTVAFNSPEGKAALQLLVDLKQASGLPADAATKGNAVEGGPLASGKVAMGYAMTKQDVEQLQKAVGAENVTVGAPLKDKEQVTFGLPGLLTRTSISKDEATTVAVARFLSSADMQVKLAKASGYFPARTDATLTDADELTTAFSKALPMAIPGEVNPRSRQVMSALSPHIQAALQGTKTVDQALADAEKECNEQLKG